MATIKEQAKELDNQITNYIEELGKLTDAVKFNEKFIEYLEFAKMFWNYSMNNQMLIMLQKSDATLVMGRKKWGLVGRNLKNGEYQKGISILAPLIGNEKVDTILTYNNTGKTEQTKIATNDTYLYGFRPVTVYDVSQTEGKPIPKLELEHRLHTNTKTYLLKQFKDYCKSKGIEVIEQKLPKNTGGLTDGKKIVLNSTRSQDDKFLTGIHELLHYEEHFKDDRELFSKEDKEIQAETCSYIVSRFVGIPSKSENYIALYNGNSKKVKQSLTRIMRVTKKIIMELGLNEASNN